MANYDDIFNASAQKGTEDKSFVSFNKEEWAAQKKQERESAFAMIDETAQRMANDGSLFQSYLDVQARFDRYSVGNAVLITAQKADATQLSDFKGWKNNGVFIKKGESGIVLLEPGEEYTKEDGTVGVSYNSKKVFDISQTTAKAKDRPAMKRDERLLLKAIIHNAPCPIEISQKLPENINAVYRPDDKKIYVRPGLEAGDIFRGISQELAHAHLDDGAYKRSDHAFTAYCVSYVLCSRYTYGPAGPRCEHVFRELYESIAYLDPGFLQLKVLELLMLLGRVPRESAADPYCSVRQAELARHLRDHLLTDREGYVSLSQLAAEHEISVSHLQKIFKRVYGVPVYHYIKEYRLEQAAVELVRSAKPVTQIAQAAGYDNASKFSACFKARYGATPSQYRAHAKHASKRSSETKTE